MSHLFRAPQGLRSASPSLAKQESPPSSSFRDRLRTSPQPPTSSMPPQSSNPLPPTVGSKREQLYRQLCTGLVLDSSPRAMAPPRHNTGTKDKDEVEQLRESLAEAGSELHAGSMEKLGQCHNEIEAEIAQFSHQVTPLLLAADTLYSNLEHPLSATICHSDTLPRRTIAAHLAELRRRLEDVGRELRGLGSEYDDCVRSEENILWKLYGDAEDIDSQAVEMAAAEKRKMEEFKREAEAISWDACQILEQVEAESKANIEAETMKMMKVMMED